MKTTCTKTVERVKPLASELPDDLTPLRAEYMRLRSEKAILASTLHDVLAWVQTYANGECRKHMLDESLEAARSTLEAIESPQTNQNAVAGQLEPGKGII